ncbi:hypothetical protein PDM89_26325 [Bacillus cereus]|nr:hypothetical protein [Bacillus cereus]
MTLGQLLAYFRRKPHVRKVLKANYLDLTKAEYANLCDWENIRVNSNPIDEDYRIDDGVNIVEVYSNTQPFKLWVEVSNKQVVRASLM